MARVQWVLDSGTRLPDPEVPIYVSRSVLEGETPPRFDYPRSRPSSDVAQKALDTYRWADDNAIALIQEAWILSSRGRHARALALACTALEEIGKSQYAADVYTGFVSPDGFDRMIRNHEFKSAYASRFVEFGPLVLPFVKDEHIAEELFKRRNDGMYASPTNKVDDAVFKRDATTLIAYCDAWIRCIRGQEEISERIGTKAFLK